MSIRWNRIAVIMLILAAIWLGSANRGAVQNTLSLVNRVDTRSSPNDQLKGLMVLGLLLVAGLAALRLLISTDRPTSGGSSDHNPQS